MRALVAGWYSFEEMGATAGDLLTRDLVCGWLDRAGVPHDVATAAPFEPGVDWRQVDPADYSHVVFACGPFGNGWPITDFLARFAGRRLIGVNLTMLESLDRWNPFDLLLARDSSADANPDASFLSRQARVPVVGVVLVHPQEEYGERGRHALADAAIERLVGSRELSVVRIDTRLDVNATGLRSAGEVESLIARMDAVVTTRLHGLVLAVKNGVPVVAVDPIAGGAKIHRQARTIGWPVVFTPETLSDAALVDALDYCLSDEAALRAQSCRTGAAEAVARVRDRFLAEFSSADPGSDDLGAG